jgi:hypothetical protein
MDVMAILFYYQRNDSFVPFKQAIASLKEQKQDLEMFHHVLIGLFPSKI